jgi:hypothetical protein
MSSLAKSIVIPNSLSSPHSATPELLQLLNS